MPHTDGSVVFARLRECASHHLHPNRHLHCTGSAPEHVRSSSGPAPFRLKILPLHVWESGPTSGSMGLESTSQTASRSVQPFLHSSPDTVPIPYNGLALFSLKIAPCIGASGPPFKHGSLGPAPESLSRNSITIDPATTGIMVVTDRPTDHAAPSVAIGRI